MISEYFDHIYCINLDKRTDRWGDSVKEFEKHNLNGVERFSAIDGNSLHLLDNPYLKNGEVGLNLTYLALLADAKKKGYKNILILEDDVVFADDCNNSFVDFFSQVPDDWKIIYFGGNHFNGKPIVIDKNVIKLTNTYATHCLAIKHDVFDEIINIVKEMKKPIDVYLTQIQRAHSTYSFVPALAWQRESYSDIQNQNTNYDYCLKY
jgi:GR25 family glycosyltransferase involved in LPS biosynthesis